jgi:hypothetical protein
MAYQVDDGNPDGAFFSGKIGFYGVTPVAQAATIAAVTTTAATQTSPFGFSTSTQADAVVSNLNSIRTALINVGILASA